MIEFNPLIISLLILCVGGYVGLFAVWLANRPEKKDVDL